MENEVTEVETQQENPHEESVQQIGVQTDDYQTVIPLDLREMTVFETKSTQGEISEIHVIHEITIGEIMITTVLFAILIFMMISRVIRRK